MTPCGQGEELMRQTTWYHHARRDLPAREEGVLPTTSKHALVPPLRQAEAVGASEMYYGYHLGQEVQQHHQRLLLRTYYPNGDSSHNGGMSQRIWVH